MIIIYVNYTHNPIVWLWQSLVIDRGHYADSSG